jgi:hypothetical protein
LETFIGNKTFIISLVQYSPDKEFSQEFQLERIPELDKNLEPELLTSCSSLIQCIPKIKNFLQNIFQFEGIPDLLSRDIHAPYVKK